MESLTAIIADTNFTMVDWGIVLVYLVLSVGIGIFANRYVGSLSDYIVAGRGMRTALGIATLTGTEMGLVTVMYSAQKGFSGGFAAFHIGIISGVLAFFIGVTGFIVTRLRREEVLTIPEYYGRRYGKGVQVFGGIMLAFGGIFNMGMFLKAGSMFIVGITGMQSEAALTVVMVVLLGLVLFYTVMGGMISVILTDYVQFVVLSFGLVLATVLCIYHLGWNHIFDVVIAEKGEVAFNPVAEGSGFGFDYVLWMAFLGLVNCALWPTAVARALSCDSEATVKKQFMFSSVTFAIRNIVPYFWGICAFVFVMEMPAMKEAFFPAEGAGTAIDTLYAMPVFLGRILPVGVIGLLTAAMIAAFMSTHDSYLLCWSSVLTNDVAKPLLGDKLSDKGAVLLTRVFVVAIGLLILLISFVYPLQADLWDYMAVTGAIYFTGAFALLAAGLYWKPASKGGAICALAAGGLAIFGLPAVQGLVLGILGYSIEQIADFGATFSSERVGLATVALAITGMVVGSLLMPDKNTNDDREVG
ncbi:MAG: sodium:solute symporter family protein [Candidatus Hydrogenedentes bacterium]|nr:sodium:solute symporter family protein [Candidatus Hydrogenedentota bacterium]